MTKKQNKNILTLILGILLISILMLGSFGGIFSITSTNDTNFNSDTDITQLQPNTKDTSKQVELGLSYLDRFKKQLSTTGFTVIDGAVCSLEPSLQYDFIGYADKSCYRNFDYDGVAFQLFEVESRDPYRSKYLGEKQVSKGASACFNINQGVDYHVDLYYCEKDELERDCFDRDGLNYFESNTLSYTYGTTTVQYDDVCLDDNRVLERYCDADNSVQSKTYTCPNKCSNGACELVPGTPAPTPYPSPTIPEDSNNNNEEVGIIVTCIKYENIGCKDNKMEQICVSGEDIGKKRLVDNTNCLNLKTDTTTTDFNLLDWINNNFLLASSFLISLLLLVGTIVIIIVYRK